MTGYEVQTDCASEKELEEFFKDVTLQLLTYKNYIDFENSGDGSSSIL